MNNKVSILMSVFNGEDFLEQALDSIFKQTYHLLEVIVVDDGSTDRTPAILSAQTDERLRVIRQANRGLTVALNHGLRCISGRYVARHDVDDVSARDRIQRQVSFLAENPEIGFVGSWVSMLDEDGSRIGARHYETDTDRLMEYHIKSNQFAHGALMFRSDMLCAAGGYREQFRYAQDYDLTLRLQERCQTANIAEELYCMRHRRGQISIVRGSEQQAFTRLAKTLAHERRATRVDSLTKDAGLDAVSSIDNLVSSDFDEIRLSLCMRSGLARKARESIGRLLRRNPVRIKLYVQWIITWTGGRLMRGLARVWDQARERDSQVARS